MAVDCVGCNHLMDGVPEIVRAYRHEESDKK